MYKLWIKVFVFILFFLPVQAKELTFVSTSPSLTEIMYAIGAQDNLKAV
jgi:hypothetical protein